DLASQYLASLGFHRADHVGEILRGGRRVADAVGHRRADIQGDDVRTLARQPGRMSTALATRGTGDEGHPPLQGSRRTGHHSPFRRLSTRLAAKLKVVLIARGWAR